MLESGPKRAQRMMILVFWLVATVSVVTFPLVVKSHPCLPAVSGGEESRALSTEGFTLQK